jgi:hypothetical protein
MLRRQQTGFRFPLAELALRLPLADQSHWPDDPRNLGSSAGLYGAARIFDHAKVGNGSTGPPVEAS